MTRKENRGKTPRRFCALAALRWNPRKRRAVSLPPDDYAEALNLHPFWWEWSSWGLFGIPRRLGCFETIPRHASLFARPQPIGTGGRYQPRASGPCSHEFAGLWAEASLESCVSARPLRG